MFRGSEYGNFDIVQELKMKENEWCYVPHEGEKENIRKVDIHMDRSEFQTSFRLIILAVRKFTGHIPYIVKYIDTIVKSGRKIPYSPLLNALYERVPSLKNSDGAFVCILYSRYWRLEYFSFAMSELYFGNAREFVEKIKDIDLKRRVCCELQYELFHYKRAKGKFHDSYKHILNALLATSEMEDRRQFFYREPLKLFRKDYLRKFGVKRVWNARARAREAKEDEHERNEYLKEHAVKIDLAVLPISFGSKRTIKSLKFLETFEISTQLTSKKKILLELNSRGLKSLRDKVKDEFEAERETQAKIFEEYRKKEKRKMKEKVKKIRQKYKDLQLRETRDLKLYRFTKESIKFGCLAFTCLWIMTLVAFTFVFLLKRRNYVERDTMFFQQTFDDISDVSPVV